MSGRVRWRRVPALPLLGERMPHARVLSVDGDLVGSIDRQADGLWCAWIAKGDAEHTEPRRSDAKRWLLARAAGLAEVPRVSAPPMIECAAPRARLPRGWRVGLAATVFGTGEPVMFYVRAWRRR